MYTSLCGRKCIKKLLSICTYTVKKVCQFVRTKRDFVAGFGRKKWPVAGLVLTTKNVKKVVAKKSDHVASFEKKVGQKSAICTYKTTCDFGYFRPFLGLFGAFLKIYCQFVRTKRDFWSIGHFFYLY